MTRSITAVFCVLLVTAGCAYRVPVQQGNIIEQEKVDQLRYGMTRSQVLFLMGNPLIDDPLHVNRWDYVYFRKVGRKRPELLTQRISSKLVYSCALKLKYKASRNGLMID